MTLSFGWSDKNSAQHQDYGHSGREGEKLEHYLFPENIYIAAYFRDMTEADGPTQCIPGSHMDPSLTPDNPDAEVASFCPRKTDVVVWDQRLWHRRGPGGGAGVSGGQPPRRRTYRSTPSRGARPTAVRLKAQ